MTKKTRNFLDKENIKTNFAPANMFSVVSVAQLVEQMTLNHWVQGSSPCGDTLEIKVL